VNKRSAEWRLMSMDAIQNARGRNEGDVRGWKGILGCVHIRNKDAAENISEENDKTQNVYLAA
jgi:hypothetical protein